MRPHINRKESLVDDSTIGKTLGVFKPIKIFNTVSNPPKLSFWNG